MLFSRQTSNFKELDTPGQPVHSTCVLQPKVTEQYLRCEAYSDPVL